MTSTPIQALVWDLDGTLIDSYGIFREILLQAAAHQGLIAPTDEVIAHNYHGTLEDSIKNVLGLADSPQLLAEIVADFLAIQEDYYQTPQDHLFGDAIALAERAHQAGLPQIVVTNRAHAGRGSASPRHIISTTTMNDYITTIVAGDDHEFSKPDARLLDAFLTEHGLKPETLLVIGDQHVDAQLAQNLNTRAVLVNRNGQTIPHLDTLKNLDDFLIVESLNEVEL